VKIKTDGIRDKFKTENQKIPASFPAHCVLTTDELLSRGEVRPASGGFGHEVPVQQHGFSSGGRHEVNAIATFITGRELFALPNNYIVRHAVLVMEDAIDAGVRNVLTCKVRFFPQHGATPSGSGKKTRLGKLDVLQWSHSWPGKWRFSSDFRIIMVSLNMF